MGERCSPERNSRSGSFPNFFPGLGNKPLIQPVRIKELIESLGSDDDSEDRDRDSEKSEEELDDIDDLEYDKVKDSDATENTLETFEATNSKVTSFKALTIDEEPAKDIKSNSPVSFLKSLPAESAPPASSFNMSLLLNDTPVKQVQVPGNARPIPCFSHKSLFVTPQNKVEVDNQKNHAPTPATIFSHWSQNRFQTPLQNQIPQSKESLNTEKSSVQTSVSKAESSRFYQLENKNVRRPLTETMRPNPPMKEPVASFAFDSRQRSLSCNSSSKMEVLYKPTLTENNLEVKENNSPNVNDHLNDENPSKGHSMPKNDSVVARVISSNYPEQKKQEMFETPKETPKLFSSMVQNNEPPKVVQQVPISFDSQINPEFLKVKNGQYQNLGIIGKGMCGKVYRVQNLTNNMLQAIKFVNLSSLDKEGIQGCLEEIRMLHKLQAPCIIKMFDYEVKKNCIYVVMELGETDLSCMIRTNSVETDLYFTLYYWRQMLIAVNHIHKNGVIHSDLKPGNFVLVQGKLKLIDFGIASSMNADMTSVVKNSTTGTINYISPEALTDIEDSTSQNAKHKINYKSDVWALGCILYSFVYGKTPFQDIRNQWQKINAIQNPKHKINFPEKSGHKLEFVPPILINVMMSCLNRDPKARPTVEQLLEISYISSQPTVSLVRSPEIPAYILVKIRQNRLTEEEWQHLIQILDQRRQS